MAMLPLSLERNDASVLAMSRTSAKSLGLYWINYRTGRVVAIVEHERDIRIPAVAKRLGVPKAAFDQFQNFQAGRDRERFLLFVFRTLPLLRVRSHRVHTAFQFSNPNETAPYRAIKKFAAKHFGPAMLLSITNFASRQPTTVNVFPHQLDMPIRRRHAVTKKKKASIPEVGIFWIDSGTMYAEGVSLSDADNYGECKIFGGSHIDVWDKAIRAVPKWHDREYEEVPRGRVVYRQSPKPEFIVCIPKVLLKHKGKVMSRFNLPKRRVRFDTSDEHYQIEPKEMHEMLAIPLAAAPCQFGK